MNPIAFDPASDELFIAKRKEIVFIEDNVADIETLIRGIGSGKEIVILDSTRDGIHQIAETLAGRTGIDALHVIAHGSEGAVDFGVLQLNAANVRAYGTELQTIGSSMAPDGDILLYGCNTGAGSDGAALLEGLAIATGADVAASSDLTGSAMLGGDWELEVASGGIETPVVVSAQTAALYQQVLSIPPVTVSFNNSANFGHLAADTFHAADDVVYKVNGDVNYQLLINGQDQGVTSYSGSGLVTLAGYGGDRGVTISFQTGQTFTATEIAISNYFNSSAQTLLIKGYDAGGHQVGSTANPTMEYGGGSSHDNFTPIPIALVGMTNIAYLKITATTFNNTVNYLVLDNLKLSNVQMPAPKITDVTSSLAAHTYRLGDTVDIQVMFDANVDVTGTPQLTLETGTTDRVINYVSGSGGSVLHFQYTVQAGDNSASLNYNSTAIALNGGTIKANGSSTLVADLTLPDSTGVHSLAANTNIVVDGVAPTLAITSNKSVLKIGDTANITFTFSEDPGATFTWNGSSGDVTVSGGILSAISGTGLVRTAVFTPTANTNGGSASISVNAGAYADAAGNANTSTSSGPAISYDTKAPTVAVSSSQPSLKVGETATITFTFSEDPGASFDVTDLTVSGGALGAISGSGTTRTAVFTPTANTNSGSATVSVKTLSFQDAAGNNNSTGGSTSLTYDTKAPALSISSDKSTLKAGDTAAITFTFSEDPGASFDDSDIAVSGGTLSAISGSGTTRTATFTPIANIDSGSASIAVAGANYADASGNTGANASLSFSYDTQAPNAPSVPVLASADDAGSSNSDGVTSNGTLHLSGSADIGSTVKLYDGATQIASTTASGGTYSFTLSGVAEGNHSYAAVAVDAAGNTSAASAGQAVVVDLTPPSTAVTGAVLSADTGASATDMVTKEASQTISGTLGTSLATGERVMVSLDNGGSWSPATASVGSNTWELAGVTLSGSNTLKVQVVDLAGNGGMVYSHAYTLDTVAPAASSKPDLDAGSDSGSSDTDNITGVTLPGFSGTAEVGASVTLFDGGIEIGSVVAVDGTWHIATTSANEMTQRIHYITAEVVDLAGNHSATSPVLEVDVRTSGPATTVASMALSVDSGTPGDFVTNQTIQNISGALSANLKADEHIEVSIDGGTTWTTATSTAGSKAWSTFVALANGTHDIKVRVVDALDNPGAVHTQAYTVDSVKPGVFIASSASTLKAGETADITFTFSEDPGTSFTNADITVSGGTLSALSGSGATRTAVFTPNAGINGGTASIAVSADSYQDLAGNLGTAGIPRTLGFDTLAPAAASAPDLDKDSDKGASDTDNLTNQTSLVFKGTAEAGATVKLYDSDGTTEIGSGTATGGSWTIATSTLGQGSHTVTAKVLDAAGNVGAVSGATVVTIDTVKPTLAIASDVSQLKAGETANISFTFSEDPGTSFTNADITVSGGTLSALGGTGTVRTAVFTPAANTNSGTAAISVGAGLYQDAAGNDGNAGTTPSLHFDTLAPATPAAPVLAADNGISSSDNIVTFADPGFKGTAEDGTIVKLYDADSGSLLATMPVFAGKWLTPPLNPMSEGPHKFYVTATDAAGNVSAPSAITTVTIDTIAPPVVTISSDVSRVKVGETATITFSFAADPGADFSLANVAPISAGSFGPLSGTGPTRTAVFTPYPNHDFESVNIRIVDYHDAAGNFTYDSTGLTLLVDTKAPAAPSTPVLSAASDTGSSSSDRITSDTTPVFSGTKELSSTVTLYDSDGSVLGSVHEFIGAWAIETAKLSEGTHTITAKQTDVLGNVSVLSNAVTIVVDTHADAPAAPVLEAASDSAAKGDGITSDTTPTLTGSAEANATVTLLDSDGSTVLGTAVADAGGAWSITSSALAAGAHDLSVRQVDVAGNASAASPVLRLNIDDAVLALAAPKLAAASDSGAAGDGITKTATPVFSGTAEALAQVTLYDGATAIGSVQADADGAWQITAATLADGVHAITARQVDRAGNASAAGTAFSLTVDTVAPAAPGAPALTSASDTGFYGDGLTENTIPVIEGTAQADTLVTLYDTVGKSTVKLGSAVADAGGKWSIATAGMALGAHTLSATASDAAGNESAPGKAFVVHIMAPPDPVSLIDGMPVKVQPISLPGNVQGSAVSIPVVGVGRTETAGQAGVADIPLASSSGGSTLLLAQLAPGYGLSASGASVPAANAAELLIASIKAATPAHTAADQGHLTGNGQSFLAGLASSSALLVETVKPVSSSAPSGMLTLSGPSAGAGQSTALVIDTGGLATGSTIALQQVNFAAVIGAANVTAGSSMVLSGDGASQHFTVAAGGKGSVFAGGGNDILSVAAIPAAGPAPASGTTLLHGGAADDAATFSGARADYNIEFHNGYVMVSTKAAPDVKAMVVNVEQLQFSDTSLVVQNNADMGTLAGMYQTVLGRQADVMGIEYWANVHQAGASWGAIALAMIGSNEHVASSGGFNGVAAHDLALLYTAIFNREADAGGMAYWTAAMGRGMTLEQVAGSFVQSVEMVGHQRAATDWDFSVG